MVKVVNVVVFEFCFVVLGWIGWLDLVCFFNGMGLKE